MWWAAGLLTGLIGVLVLVHMTRPRFERRRMSAARFFKDLPPPRQGQPRLRLSNPVTSRPFYLQLLSLLLLLLALLSTQISFAQQQARDIGMWILLDTSASMSTGSRMSRAVGEVRQALGQPAVCIRASAFDMERRDLTPETVIVQEPRALGTDLNLVRGLVALLETQPPGECAITHVLVVSDMPAPEWVATSEGVRVVWRSVTAGEPNIGLTQVQATRNALTGRVQEVLVEVVGYGDTQSVPAAQLEIFGPGANLALPIDWAGERWQDTFVPDAPGEYTLRLSAGGAYALDDEITFEIPGDKQIAVDWQLGDHPLREQLPWLEDANQPDFRIAAFPPDNSTMPTLFVGPGYTDEGAAFEIRDFYEASPLLNDLNFDVLEELSLPGVRLPESFRPVLRGTDQRVRLAERDDPPAVYVPGLPTGTDDNLGRTSTIIFFNAVRGLLASRPVEPLYTLTTPEDPTPRVGHLPLHAGEGNTARAARSFGTLSDLQSFDMRAVETPLWPLLLVLALLVFAVERGLALFGGGAWR